LSFYKIEGCVPHPHYKSFWSFYLQCDHFSFLLIWYFIFQSAPSSQPLNNCVGFPCCRMSSAQNYSCVLPENMLMEILSWLPPKDVVWFRCVSKEWNHLVSDPAFVKLHLQRSPKNTHILLTFVQDKDYAVICPIQDLLDNPSFTLETLHRNNRPFTLSWVSAMA